MSGAFPVVYRAKRWIGAEGGLQRPSGAAYDSREKLLYICDMENGRVAAFGEADGSLRILGAGTGRVKPVKPLAVSVKEGRIAVTDAEENAVYVYEGPAGWQKLRTRGRLTLRLPGGIAWGEGNNLYAADFLNKRICVIDQGLEMTVLHGIPCGEPYGIFYARGVLYVADAAYGCIRCYRTETGELHTLELCGHRPISVTADTAGNIWFSETRALFRLDIESGEIAAVVDRRKFREWGFGRPGHIGAVAQLPDGRIVFTDTLTHCVYCLTPSGGELL